MADRETVIIEPRAAPLSHVRERQRYALQIDKRHFLTLGLVVVTGFIAYLFWGQTYLFETPSKGAPSNNTHSQQYSETAGDQSSASLLPFAQTQQQLARERAQQALAGFVEQQILLETQMQVSGWGKAQLSEALRTAQQGDLEFASDLFDAAVTTYQRANAQLDELIKLGHLKVSQHLQEANAAINARDPKAAQDALERAAEIQPNHSELAALTARIQVLPQVIDLFRDAKNSELSGRYVEALELYRQIEQLDPLSTGLTNAVAAVQRQALASKVEQTISNGFDKLNRRDYDGARRAFNAALQLAPGDTIALGGLQQVAQANDLDLIATHRKDAETAMANQPWQQAMDAYQAILSLDKNIRFAATGLAQATAHQRSHKLLTTISAQPSRLSSQSLFLQAEGILEEAEKLSYAGPVLTELITTTRSLLAQYRDPVEVQLISDNRTNVIVSNVGRLGFFDQKQITLRPGEYTIRGSQDGCRDLLLSVLVVPGIEPIDVRCQERL